MGLLAGLGGIAAVAAVSKSSSSSPTPPKAVSGSVADGYISGAEVWVDVNKSGKVDQGDIKVGITNGSGKFSGTIDQAYASYNLLVVGGIDTSTQLAFKGILKAPANYSVVNPLTTLVSYLKDAGVADPEAKVLSALGLTTAMQSAGASLASYDPLAVLNDGASANAVVAAKVQAAALQVANVIVTGSAAVVGASSNAGAADKIDDAAGAVMTAFADAIKTGASFDLTDGSKITTLLSSSTLKTAAASAGLTLDNTKLTSKATAAGLALDAVNTVIGDAVANSTSANAVDNLSKAVQAQYVAQNIPGDASTSLMSNLLSSSESTNYVQNNYNSV
ncbi:MAG: hypothetical protein EBU72_13020, partial [Betaproteobacteria bacterium]|nr:hypothetical protein [Betaproteobacteria bacterium]